jgi:uncharacterized protein (TIGR00255 family)
MISSMTGFAAAAHESAQGSLAVELKTVNHRYLEFQTRIPEELRPLEPAMREAVAARLTRGKVDCRVTYHAARRRSAPSSRRAGDGRAARRGAQVRALSRGARALGLRVLHWPGVLADEALSPTRSSRADGRARTRIGDLDASREREGAKLEAVLRERLDAWRAGGGGAPLVPRR